MKMTTAAETRDFINNLLQEFRDLVVEVEDENRLLKNKLKALYGIENINLTTRRSLTTSAAQNSDNNTLKTILRTRHPSLGSSEFTSSSNSNKPVQLTDSSNTASSEEAELLVNRNTVPQTTTLTSLSTIGLSSSSGEQTGQSSNNTRPPPYKAITSKSATTNVAATNTFNINNFKNTLEYLKNRRNTIAGNRIGTNHISLNLAPEPPIRRRRRSTIFSTLSNLQKGDMAAQRGALIVLEGLDRVGKSTLAHKLVEHLKRMNRPVEYCRFPNRTTPIGTLIDDLLKNTSKHIDDHAMHLLFSANRWEMNKQLRSKILQGTTVVVDRYSFSGIAYSCAKRGLTIEWCRQMEIGLPKPDLVIYLELSKEAQYKREGFGDERFETKEFQEKIRLQYDSLIKTSDESWLRIDVEYKGPEQVLSEVISPVKKCLETCALQPLGDINFK